MPPASEKVPMKFCIVGASGVGKTALLHRFVADAFDERYIATLGAKVAVKEIRLQHQGKIFVAVASIWDIMGNEAFRDLMKDSFFSQAHGVLAVCDASRPSTLGSLDEWHKCVEEVCGKVPFHVLLNKADLASEGDLKEADVRAFCTARGWSCCSASAKTGAGVWEAFQRLAKSALEEPRKVATVVSQ